ncbi:hypothetical protein AVEN_57949-1 [Araneus ventricosus]|uniref:Uncharacterized protein n=1 Tax=Araneus ventricosus TaxID=182803 RepID=A0A4Y2JD20_ARAVE|nr:hypothetical protein AVEN_57949-1 [Araneus ventricosus]
MPFRIAFSCRSIPKIGVITAPYEFHTSIETVCAKTILHSLLDSLIPERLVSSSSFKTGSFVGKRRELDSPNLGGHFSHHLSPYYNLPFRRAEMGCGLQG